ncbi:glycosyltransferase family 4 protein [Segetibacter aerophilus]|uniref:Glycosyl transferase family 1 domain-containing protein n=1 Tax=Segetibacter aerophilus TaxID=670293 RepID=A0A512B6P4_9BACT|nr:glycosyltransferase family 4 protein [Segetibacter aerophilus]GEO07625.1 hypothetical protein SAE01_01210 [Segetibacter aerophilus]
MKIVLITTGQPSVNPRVVKEADALTSAGHDVIVLFSFWIQWANEADVKLLSHVKWAYKLIGGSPNKNKAIYFFTRARFLICKELNKKFGNKHWFAERAQARCFNELLQAAQSLKATWYIGHNLGALAVAVIAAEFQDASAGFDFEDYHREENTDMLQYEHQRIVYLEEKYIPRLNYVSTASSLITAKVKQHFPFFSKPLITLLNCFSLAQQPSFNQKADNDNTLNLFWFSQTVGTNRGLELVLNALKALNDESIFLTLVGRCTTETKESFQRMAGGAKRNIHFAGIVEPVKIINIAATMDIGLALEPSIPINRDICLTNKIFTYLLAGNAVILSDTSMQKLFNEKYNIGQCIEGNQALSLAEKIKTYKNKKILNAQRQHNYQLAHQLFNWEHESKKLLQLLS